MRLSRFRINSEFARQRITLAFTILLTTLLLSLVGVAVCPLRALADYSNPSVHTVAQMRTDGSLRVVEQRSLSFQERYAAITWPFTGITDKQEIEIAAVRIIQMDEEGNIVRDWDQLPEVGFQSPWREFIEETAGEANKVKAAEERMERTFDASEAIDLPDSDSYTFDKRRHCLYVFLEPTEHSTVIECDYEVTNAALVYDDTAEMYWDYVPAQPDVEMSNVRTQIQLPVPDGVEVVPGENVLAWGHGPDGTVDVRADGTVHYEVPYVGEGQYAQAHVLFPRQWLTNITVQSKLAKSGTRFDDAVAEEASWSDTYTWGVVNAYWIDIATLLLCIIALIAAAGAYVAWGREPKPEEACMLSRDSVKRDKGPDPMSRFSDDKPVEAAVIGRLLRWNHHSAYDFAATLRQLQKHGVITISQDGLETSDVRFRITPSAKSAKLSDIEQGALKLLFELAGDGYQSVSLGELQAFCKRHPADARQAMAKWQDALSAEVRAARVFDLRSKTVSRWLYGIGAVFILLAILDGALTAWALLATGIAMIVIAYNMPHRTSLGVCLAESARGEDERAYTRETANGIKSAEDAPAKWEVTLCNAFGDALTA